MLSSQQLLKHIEATIGKRKVLQLSGLIVENAFPLNELIDLTFHTDKNIGFRASWILENVLQSHPEIYADSLLYLIARFADISNPSSQRHYANIMIRLTAAKAPDKIKEALAGMDMEPVVEKLFDWLISPDILVAVKCSAGEALLHLSRRYSWISEELPAQMQFLMKNGTPAMQARGNMILKKLGSI